MKRKTMEDKALKPEREDKRVGGKLEPAKTIQPGGAITKPTADQAHKEK